MMKAEIKKLREETNRLLSQFRSLTEKMERATMPSISAREIYRYCQSSPGTRVWVLSRYGGDVCFWMDSIGILRSSPTSAKLSDNSFWSIKENDYLRIRKECPSDDRRYCEPRYKYYDKPF